MSNASNSDTDIDIESDGEERLLRSRNKGKGRETTVVIRREVEPSSPKPETLSKETRKLRKKKQSSPEAEALTTKKHLKKSILQRAINLMREEQQKQQVSPSPDKKLESEESTISSPKQEEVSDEDKAPYLRSTRGSSQFYFDEDIDEFDTDDLLDEIEQLPPLRKKLTVKKKSLKKARSKSKKKSKQATSLAEKANILKRVCD